MWQPELYTDYSPALSGLLSPPARQVAGPAPVVPSPTSAFNTRAEFLPQATGALDSFLPPVNDEPAPDAPLFDRYNDPARDKWMWLLQASLGMAEAAGKPGSTALGALGAGGRAATSEIMKVQADRERARREEALRRQTLAVQLTQAQKDLKNKWDVKISDNGDAVRFNKETGETVTIPGATGPKDKGEFSFLLGKLKDPNLSDDERADVRKRLSVLQTQPGAANVTITNVGEKAASGAYGKGAGEDLLAQVQAGSNAFDSLKQLDSLEDKLGEVETGPLAKPVNTLQALAANVGVDLKEHAKKIGVNLNDVDNPQVFGAVAESLVIENLKKMGAKPTDRDMQSLRSIYPELGKSPGANQQLIDMMRKQFESSVGGTRELLDIMKDDPDFQNTSRYHRAIFERRAKQYDAMKAERAKRIDEGKSDKPMSLPAVKSRYQELYSKSPEEAAKFLQKAVKRGDVKPSDIRGWAE